MRQSAFALLGDLAKTFSEHLRPVLLQFAGLAVANLEANMITQHSMPACNNACWSLGELPCLPGSHHGSYLHGLCPQHACQCRKRRCML